jgi:predicted dehydrogenase
VADGVLGQLVYTEAEYYHPGIGRDGDGLSWRDGQKTWRYGFPPMLYPTHTTAFLVGVTGERLTKVSCVGTSDPDEPAMRDNRYGNPFLNGTAMFTTSGGNAFKGNVGWNVQAHGERAQWFGRAGSFYMPTSAGQPFSIHLPGRPDIHELPDYFHLLPPDMRYDSGHGASHPHITHEFVMAVLEDREPATDVYEALAYAVPGVVAHESSFKDGEQLEIPQFDSDA